MSTGTKVLIPLFRSFILMAGFMVLCVSELYCVLIPLFRSFILIGPVKSCLIQR